MISPWLRVTMDKLVNTYKKNYTLATMKPLFEALHDLAKKIIGYFRQKKAFRDYIKNHEERCKAIMVFGAFIRLNKFDSNKGKALNYFSTIMISELRQLCMTSRNYIKLKEKYYNEKSKNNKP